MHQIRWDIIKGAFSFISLVIVLGMIQTNEVWLIQLGMIGIFMQMSFVALMSHFLYKGVGSDRIFWVIYFGFVIIAGLILTSLSSLVEIDLGLYFIGYVVISGIAIVAWSSFDAQNVAFLRRFKGDYFFSENCKRPIVGRLVPSLIYNIMPYMGSMYLVLVQDPSIVLGFLLSFVYFGFVWIECRLRKSYNGSIIWKICES